MEQFTIYEGQLNSHGKAHGMGKMRWKTNGDTYKGEFKSGFPHGEGVMFYNTLQYTYTGSFSMGKRHGIGYLLLPSKDLISGNFIQDHLEGYAVIYYNNGDFFEGFMQKNVKSSEGLMRYANGNIYIGNWNNDKRHGLGKLTYPDGVQSLYGIWNSDKFSGRGKVVKYQEGNKVLTVYEGQFMDGELTGEGVMTDSLGIYYKGEFVNGQMHGAGELLLPNGSRYVGQFLYNTFKRGKGENPDRTVAYGNFYNMSPDGVKVKMHYNNGDEYEGGMKEGVKTGIGVHVNENGARTLGRFDGELIKSMGHITYPDGIDLLATWKTEKERVSPSPKKNLNKW